MEEYKRIDDYYFKPTGKPLGKGAFATVFKGYKGLETQIQVAIKMIPATKMLESQENYDLFMREIEVLRQIKGDHIVQLLDVKRTPNNLYLFTEFCNGGDLDTLLKKNGAMSEEDGLELIYQFSAAFNTINDLDVKNSAGRRVIIMHRDIKAANILFHDGVMKIADFGFAKMIDEAAKNVKMQHTLLGTPLYMSPQILNDESYTPKCDIWSAGVVFYECLFKKLPWNGTSIANLYRSIKTTPLKFPKEVGEDTKDLITKMLQIDEAKRISWKEMEEHPAIKAGKEIFKKKHSKEVIEESQKKTNDKTAKKTGLEATNETTTQNTGANPTDVNAETTATVKNAGTDNNLMGLQTQNQANPNSTGSNPNNFPAQNQGYMYNPNGPNGFGQQNTSTMNNLNNTMGYIPQNQPSLSGNYMGPIPQNQIGMVYTGGYQQQQQIPTQLPQNGGFSQPYYGPTNTFPQTFQPDPYQQQQPNNYFPPNSFSQTTFPQNNSYQNSYGGYQQQQQGSNRISTQNIAEGLGISK